MSGDKAFLNELEQVVRYELTRVDGTGPENGTEAARPRSDEWPFDPADVEREEVGLRNLLGALEAVERDEEPGPDLRPSRAVARDH